MAGGLAGGALQPVTLDPRKPKKMFFFNGRAVKTGRGDKRPVIKKKKKLFFDKALLAQPLKRTISLRLPLDGSFNNKGTTTSLVSTFREKKKLLFFCLKILLTNYDFEMLRNFRKKRSAVVP